MDSKNNDSKKPKFSASSQHEAPAHNPSDTIKVLSSELYSLVMEMKQKLKANPDHDFKEQTNLQRKTAWVLAAEPNSQEFAERIYTFSNQLLKLPEKKIDSELRCCIAIKLVQAAAQLNRLEELFQSQIIHKLAEAEPHFFGIPFLMLSALSLHPIASEFPFPESSSNALKYLLPRQNNLFIFYRALNYLFLRKYSIAKTEFIHLLSLEKNNKDFLIETYKYLSLSCFLLGDSENIFQHYLNQNPSILLTGESMDIWSIDRYLYPKHLSDEYKLFLPEIIHEKAKRVLIDFAQTCSEAPISDVRAIAGDEFEKAINEINETGEYSIQRAGDILIFHELDLTTTIQERDDQLTKLRMTILGN